MLACTDTSERDELPPMLPPTDKRSATLTRPSAATGALIGATEVTEAADLPDTDSVAETVWMGGNGEGPARQAVQRQLVLRQRGECGAER